MRKRLLQLAGLMCLCFVLAGCGSEGGVFVQSVKELAAQGGIAPGDKFACVVVSEYTAEIKKDNEKTVAELMVQEGDAVTEGQELFSYDTDELQLSLDRLTLERDQLESSIASYNQQIAQLTQDRNSTGGNERLQYTLQLQSVQVDLKEAEIKLKSKNTEVERAQELLENATVLSPINGRVQSINESGTDSEGNTAAYIVIQKSGAYRIKGTINEQQRGGINVGDRVKMQSRVNEEETWTGTVTVVDYENPVKSNDSYYGYSTDEMSSSSKYPFYVALDSTEGLMMGQHLYLQLDTGDTDTTGLSLDAAFLCFDETTGEPYVWADKGGKLEKRSVTVGEMNPEQGTYPILSGLSETDYIAYPDAETCKVGQATTKVAPTASAASEG